MDQGNRTQHTEFTLLGLTDDPNLKVFLFAIFTFVYIFTVIGNTGIIVAIQLTPRLHTPMYFFLRHLSFLDIGYSSDIAPRMLADLLSDKNKISYAGCVVQLFFFFSYGTIEALLLAAMAFDRYVAVCRPLHYTTIMTRRVCIQLMMVVYGGGILHSMIQTSNTFRQSFCHWEIHHFCCDIPPLLKLSCTDTYSNEVILFVFASIFASSSFTPVFVSYLLIILAVLKMQSSAARLRVFSTCGSHFTGVILYFGTIVYTYLRPSSSYSLDQDKAVTLFYTVVIPMLNPLIYSLRNKDVKEGLGKIVLRKSTHKRLFPQHM